MESTPFQIRQIIGYGDISYINVCFLVARKSISIERKDEKEANLTHVLFSLFYRHDGQPDYKTRYAGSSEFILHSKTGVLVICLF